MYEVFNSVVFFPEKTALPGKHRKFKDFLNSTEDELYKNEQLNVGIKHNLILEDEIIDISK